MYPSPRTCTIHVLPPRRQTPRLADMPPGQLFRADGQDDRVFVRLMHAQLVADATTVWCVVVAAKQECGLNTGALVAMPRDTAVEPLFLAAPLRLSREPQ
jgi:hypothetical protein